MKSYARNIKLHNIDFPSREAENTAYDLLDVDSSTIWGSISDRINDFSLDTCNKWEIITNGRNGGYAVLVSCDNYRDIDSGEDFSEWADSEIEDRVELVKLFDETVEDCINMFVKYASTNQVIEKEVLVPKKVKVAIPISEAWTE